MDGALNQYTNITIVGGGSGFFGSVFNFLENKLVVASASSTYVIDLTSKTAILKTSGTVLNNLIYNSSPPRQGSFNYYNNTISSIGDIVDYDYAINCKFTAVRGVAFDPMSNLTWLNDTGNQLRSYDSKGRLFSIRNLVTLNGAQNVKFVKGSTLVGFNTATNRYIYISDASTYNMIDYRTIEGYVTNMFLYDIAICYDICVFTNTVSKARLFVFDANSKSYIGYKDLDTDVLSICSNQHI